MTIKTRASKGSPLTWSEIDANFTELDSAKATQAALTNEISRAQTAEATKESTANKGIAGGYASLDGTGKVPATQLPSYVDDVIEADSFALLPATGEKGKIYVTIDDNKEFRWSGSIYVEIAKSTPPVTLDPVSMSIIFGA